MLLARTTREVTAIITTRRLEPGTHISRRTIATVDVRRVTLETPEYHTGTIYGGLTVSLMAIECELRRRGHLPPLDDDHIYMIGVEKS
jgi:hypothetical protein